jgi:hypothetical protein
MKNANNEAGARLKSKNLPGNRDLNQAKRWGGWVGKKEKEKEITS